MKEGLFLASVLDSAGLPAVSSVSWLIQASSRSPPSSSHRVHSACLSVIKCPLYKGTSHVGLAPTPMTSHVD